MSMSDPIADLLTRLRNGLHAEFDTVKVPASRLKEDICNVLQSEGFIQGYERHDDGKQGMLHIQLKYTPDREPVIQGLKRISKPSLRIYNGHNDIPLVRSGLGISILSTSNGVMTGKNANNQNIGGELLCEIW
jgi:small subunit ribosomal protein S8